VAVAVMDTALGSWGDQHREKEYASIVEEHYKLHCSATKTKKRK